MMPFSSSSFFTAGKCRHCCFASANSEMYSRAKRSTSSTCDRWGAVDGIDGGDRFQVTALDERGGDLRSGRQPALDF